jgi:hypothetical protein
VSLHIYVPARAVVVKVGVTSLWAKIFTLGRPTILGPTGNLVTNGRDVGSWVVHSMAVGRLP